MGGTSSVSLDRPPLKLIYWRSSRTANPWESCGLGMSHLSERYLQCWSRLVTPRYYLSMPTSLCCVLYSKTSIFKNNFSIFYIYIRLYIIQPLFPKPNEKSPTELVCLITMKTSESYFEVFIVPVDLSEMAFKWNENIRLNVQIFFRKLFCPS